MMKIRIKRIIKLTSVVFCVLIIIIVRFMLKKTVTNTRDYYFEDKKISVAYELESIYNPIIHEYNIIGEITIVGFQFIVYGEAIDNISFDIEINHIEKQNTISDEVTYVNIKPNTVASDYDIFICESLDILTNDNYSGSPGGYIMISLKIGGNQYLYEPIYQENVS